MTPEIDPAQIEALTQQAQQQQQPVADAAGSGLANIAEVAIDAVTSDAGEGILDAIGGIFSIFD